MQGDVGRCYINNVYYLLLLLYIFFSKYKVCSHLIRSKRASTELTSSLSSSIFGFVSMTPGLISCTKSTPVWHIIQIWTFRMTPHKNYWQHNTQEKLFLKVINHFFKCVKFSGSILALNGHLKVSFRKCGTVSIKDAQLITQSATYGCVFFIKTQQGK